ncbi:putative transferase [Ancylobacter novellus DSM 506]|uniref:Transferase n=1 Tax=Ancylobacter novellus (strain ATCC 8093 / DSM 506 / JCM 20403 / CCM 1077 / IAM 12100 / NBRC 12443 / NCIMB 10456) TaxID=639283 RepID=D7A6A0_ANCN5|nr:lipase chaperone [Ancylobacter novellus]ADH88250.1 putative transferase [Ancylobacter novellus DSM 506]
MLQTASVTVKTPSSGTLRDSERIAYARREPTSVAQLMSQHLDLARPGSDAEALRLLRQAFPGAPLTARVEAMMRRAR